MKNERSEERDSLSRETAEENERLASAIAAGDLEAERAFVLRYTRPVKAMLLARSRNPDLAADLLQEAMIEAICALRRGQLKEPAKLGAFVAGVARNVLNSHFRSSRRMEPVDLPEDLPDLGVSELAAEEREREARALQAISTLDVVDRTILQMTLVQGLKPGAIAERLRLKPDVVRQRKLRATRRVIELVRGPSQSGVSSHLLPGRAK